MLQGEAAAINHQPAVRFAPHAPNPLQITGKCVKKAPQFVFTLEGESFH
jgi:hypothetical protein